MDRRTANLAIASSVISALAVAAAPASADDNQEKCYGISKAGQNDCASTGDSTCAGTSKVDYDKDAWKFVAKGTCEKITVKLPDGSTRMGSLVPWRQWRKTRSPAAPALD
jgi:uncharacterized membrane protein